MYSCTQTCSNTAGTSLNEIAEKNLDCIRKILEFTKGQISNKISHSPTLINV